MWCGGQTSANRRMNAWPTIRAEYLAWVRAFPMLTAIAQPGSSLELTRGGDEPVYQDVKFWSARTHEAEARCRRHLTDPEIDAVIDEVAAVIDEDLLRFNPMIAYFARFFPDGDSGRIEDEREVAHCVKRDLGWAALERAIGEPEFFASLLPVYDRGRWPCGWSGVYPAGRACLQCQASC